MDSKRRHNYKVHIYQEKENRSRNAVLVAETGIKLVFEPSTGMFIDQNAKWEKSVYCASPVIIAK